MLFFAIQKQFQTHLCGFLREVSFVLRYSLYQKFYFYSSFSYLIHLRLCVFPSGRSLLFGGVLKTVLECAGFLQEILSDGRRLEISCKTAGLNLQAPRTQHFFCQRNNNVRPGKHMFKLEMRARIINKMK